MDTLVKLKNTNLIKIETDWDTETLGNYTLQETINTSDIEFQFSNGDKFTVSFKDVDLTLLLSFFYGKDFSNITSGQMCIQFLEHIGNYYLNFNGNNVLNCYYYIEETCDTVKYRYDFIDKKFVDYLPYV